MKRFVFWMVLGIVAVSWLRAHADRQARERAQREFDQLARSLDEYHHRYGEPAPRRVVPAQFPPPPQAPPREAYGDIPVPIVPGTRVTRAEVRPPQPPPMPQPYQAARHLPTPPSDRPQERPTPPPPEPRTISGRLSATPDRARADARLMLERAVADWIESDVPRSWKVPASLIDAMVVDVQVKAVEKDLGTLYEASVRANFSPARRAEIVETYHRELVARRLAVLAGILAFVLTCLAALAGYIRADEATKGYYTNHLRLAAAAGVGAAGVVIYQLLA